MEQDLPLSLTQLLVKICIHITFIGFIMALFYEDEDQILPLLLHRVEPGMPECSSRDCQGIRERMRQLSLEPAQFSNHLVA